MGSQRPEPRWEGPNPLEGSRVSSLGGIASARKGRHGMMMHMVRAKRRQVLVDINTQQDFFLADGLVCIRNHRRVLAHIRRLMAWARRRDISVISTCEVYPDHNGRDGEDRYCVDGTSGQTKIGYTLLNNRISFAADGSTDLPRDMLRH